jgi:hypothetical protein
MRHVTPASALPGLIGTLAPPHTADRLGEPATIQPVYWSGDYCGPRSQWWRHRRRESHHRRREERRYSYHPYYRY